MAEFRNGRLYPHGPRSDPCPGSGKVYTSVPKDEAREFVPVAKDEAREFIPVLWGGIPRYLRLPAFREALRKVRFLAYITSVLAVVAALPDLMTFRPSVSVSSTQPIVTDNALATPFMVEKKGILPIKNAEFGCAINYIKTPHFEGCDVFVKVHRNPIDLLKRTSTVCPLAVKPGRTSAIRVKGPVTSAIIEVVVTYDEVWALPPRERESKHTFVFGDDFEAPGRWVERDISENIGVDCYELPQPWMSEIESPDTLEQDESPAAQDRDLKRGAADLEELRQLVRTHSDAPGIRQVFAMALFQDLNYAREQHDLELRNAFLDELRQLARVHPADPAVRQLLAKGLLKTLYHAKEAQDLKSSKAQLDELRQLTHDHPADPAVREQLAIGLFKTLIHAREERNLELRDALFDELRQLAHEHRGDPNVRKLHAKGLFNTLFHAQEERDLKRRDTRLEDLRQLYRDYPADPAVREQLANSLLNTGQYAKEERDLKRRDACLEDLRQLYRDNPADPAVQSTLANGVYNNLNDATEERNLELRDALFDELRQLYLNHPDDPAARGLFAFGLGNMLVNAKAEADLKRRDTRLEDLRQLYLNHPDDPAVRAALAMGLSNTLIHAKEEADAERLRREDARPGPRLRRQQRRVLRAGHHRRRPRRHGALCSSASSPKSAASGPTSTSTCPRATSARGSSSSTSSRSYGAHGAAMTANVITYRRAWRCARWARCWARPDARSTGWRSCSRSHEYSRRPRRPARDTLREAASTRPPPASATCSRSGRPRCGPAASPGSALGRHGDRARAASTRWCRSSRPACRTARVIQWDKDDCADLGIIKIDLLGLGMLAALEECIPLIREHEGVEIDLAHLPPDDPDTYAMIQRADTIGVFQIESRAQMATLPAHEARAASTTWWWRSPSSAPVPIVGEMVHPYLKRRAGREPVISYPHPSLEPILKRTLGVPALPGAAAADRHGGGGLQRRRGRGAAPGDGLQALDRAHAGHRGAAARAGMAQRGASLAGGCAEDRPAHHGPSRSTASRSRTRPPSR